MTWQFWLLYINGAIITGLFIHTMDHEGVIQRPNGPPRFWVKIAAHAIVCVFWGLFPLAILCYMLADALKRPRS